MDITTYLLLVGLRVFSTCMREYWGWGWGGLTVTGGSMRCTLLSSISISLYTDAKNKVKTVKCLNIM